MTTPLSAPNFKFCPNQNGNMQCFSFIQSTKNKCKVNNNSCSYTYAYKFCTCQDSDQATARKIVYVKNMKN